MVLAYSRYLKLVYDVTSDHMTMKFEIVWRKTAKWQEEINKEVGYLSVMNLIWCN